MPDLKYPLSGRPLIFGEVLYDVFESEHKKILGGAPFNVAWHLQGFALAPRMITRIGQDIEGDAIFQTMQRWGMDTQGVQRDHHHPTGQVRVSLTAGSPQFEIPTEQAYDYLESQPVLEWLPAQDWALLYHGSLALRHPTSRACLQTIAAATHCPIFLDINLRSPWWEKDFIHTLMKTATWLKVNEDELAVIAPHFPTATAAAKNGILAEICERYQLEMIIVTLGDKGALLKMPQQPVLQQTPPSIQVIDSVGAGDAFSAVCIAGLLQHWSPEILLERAVKFAAAVCQLRGATTSDQDFYHQI